MVYFAVGALGLEGGIMVTASHNPKQYTGMKIVRRGALPVGSDSGLFEIRDRAMTRNWSSRTRRCEVSRGHLGLRTSSACCRSSTSPRSARCGS